jgi:hypothetical protein
MFGVTVWVRDLAKFDGFEKLYIEPVGNVLFWGIKWLGLLFFIFIRAKLKGTEEYRTFMVLMENWMIARKDGLEMNFILNLYMKLKLKLVLI